MSILKVEMPPKLIPIFSHPRGALRWRVLRGGRGSGKSFTAAKMAAIWGAVESLRIVCTREYQNTIAQSFHAELKNSINSCAWLSSQYDVGVDYLRHKTNGTEFLFKGLRHNIDGIKSMAQIDLVIVEEAETVPARSWQDLIPTIRAPNSEIWVIYNPRSRDSWVAKSFDSGQPPPRSSIVTINHNDNPWFSKELEEQRLHDLKTMDPRLYAHVWDGEYWEQSDAQVFRGKYSVSTFTPSDDWDGPYNGLDFGFANDPTAAVRAYIDTAKNTLYISHDFAQVGLELDDTAKVAKENIPDIEHFSIRADNARPESISYLKRHGLPYIVPCEKGKGSVEDGVQFIKSFDKVIIHPRCTHAIKEFNYYSYKVDRHSGDIMPIIIDENNHVIDALRYALEPIMKQQKKQWGFLL